MESQVSLEIAIGFLLSIYVCSGFGQFTDSHEEVTWTKSFAPQNTTSTKEVVYSVGEYSPRAFHDGSHTIVPTRQPTNDAQDNHRNLSEGTTTNEILLACGFAFTFFFGTLGNTFVCYFFGFKSKKHRNVTESLILYLGFVDLLASIVNPLLFSYWTISRYSRWDFGVVGCKILAPLAPVSATVSASIIMIICIDRYRAIVSPFNGQFAKKQVNAAVAIAIILSIASHANYIYYLEVDAGVPCFVVYGGELGYAVPYIVGTILRDLTYIGLFCFTTIAISRRLKQRKYANVNLDYSVRCRKESRKIVRVLYRIGLIFAILVFPKDVLSIASTISWLFPPGIPSSSMLLYINGWLKVLNVSNSCVNVFIYAHVHTRFKREICKLLPACMRKTRSLSVARQTFTTEYAVELREIVAYCQKPEGENYVNTLEGEKV